MSKAKEFLQDTNEAFSVPEEVVALKKNIKQLDGAVGDLISLMKKEQSLQGIQVINQYKYLRDINNSIRDRLKSLMPERMYGKV